LKPQKQLQHIPVFPVDLIVRVFWPVLLRHPPEIKVRLIVIIATTAPGQVDGSAF
jgi:hypothetical protein